MIYYDTENLWEIIFRWHGSALNGTGPKRAIMMALFALGVATANYYHEFVVPTRESTAFVDTLTVFNTFLGLIMSFRMNSAFQQWRSGVVAISSLGENARGIVSSGCAYVCAKAPAKEVAEATKSGAGQALIPHDIIEKCKFFNELRRLVFLYIAIVFHDFRGRNGIESMRQAQILTESEYDELYACGSEQPMPSAHRESYQSIVCTQHRYRATIVELWLKRLVEVASQRGHLTPVNANTLQLKIAQLPAIYTTVFNIANVPIPFCYNQYLQFLIMAYMMLYTFVIVPRSGFYTPIWVLFWGIFLFTADQVAMEIECPFGLDANDIDLEARLLQIEEELKLLIRSQYYFMSGGTSFTKLVPSNSFEASAATSVSGSSADWKSYQNPEGLYVPPAPLKEAFSFHQGHLPVSSPGHLPTQHSLPEIDEYTSLILHNSKSSDRTPYSR
ncbi:TPA: hypothetical protein N0F65_012186 [Lagenidium giganteum]|uniref:Bestrophin homolog n=1 Tax=Lagenidium giganteum TaxID=4803 RepID=A0AAV2ZB12_9STRA|nr:TPA: hypothetical protein N0F65_012186 [Lagenidium giganteum]